MVRPCCKKLNIAPAQFFLLACVTNKNKREDDLKVGPKKCDDALELMPSDSYHSDTYKEVKDGLKATKCWWGDRMGSVGIVFVPPLFSSKRVMLVVPLLNSSMCYFSFTKT
jgi:hypothetical protein